MANNGVSAMTRPADPALAGTHFLSMHPTPAFTALLPEGERLSEALRRVILEREAAGAHVAFNTYAEAGTGFAAQIDDKIRELITPKTAPSD